MADPIQGAAEKISGLLNPQKDNQVPETKAKPSESIPETQEVQESQSESNETSIEQTAEKIGRASCRERV